MTIDNAQKQAAIAIVQAIAGLIRELGVVPSGELYAHVMGHMSLESYNHIIDLLIDAKVVRRDPSHLLTWIGGNAVCKDVQLKGGHSGR